MSTIDLATVQQQATAFQTAKLVLTGAEIGLFTALADGPATADQLCDRLELHPRGTGLFLDALVALGLLEQSGGKYSNGPVANQFLSANGENFLGGFLSWADQVMYPAWGQLGVLLRTGKPPLAAESGHEMFDGLWDDPVRVALLTKMTESISRPLIPTLVKAFDWESHRSVVDLGGCRGDTLALVAQEYPHLDAIVFDLPAVRPQFDEHMAELGPDAARLRFQGGDFFADDIPKADLLMLNHALVDWTEDQRRELLARTFPAVNPGGALLICDSVIVEGEPSYFRNLVRGINMQLMTPGGGGHRLSQLTDWLHDAGYGKVEHRPLSTDMSLVIANKPA